MSKYHQLITAKEFMHQLSEQGDWFTGVPSGRLKALYKEIPQDKYYFAPREDHALAMAFGARLMGKKPVVFMQNSGVGYIGDVVCGLHKIYNVGVIMVVDCIGEFPDNPPQHVQWGYLRTLQVLEALNVWIHELSGKEEGTRFASDIAWRTETPVAILVREGMINAD